LREFPVEAAAPARQPSDTEVDAILRGVEANLGKIPGQKIVLKIVRKSFPQARGDHVVARHRKVFPEAKTGPRGSWKNRPD
jgi:hypothetical protein